jgi:hypothetical protein
LRARNAQCVGGTCLGRHEPKKKASSGDLKRLGIRAW